MDTTTIKEQIDTTITTNGNGDITGEVLNETLNDIVDAVAPKLYEEDPDTDRVTIETNEKVIIHGVEGAELSTGGWRVILSEEEGVEIGNSAYPLQIINGRGVLINDELVLTESDLGFVSHVLGVDYFYATKQYAVGDLVLRYNILYRFKVSHLGAWSSADVEQTSLRELLNF